MNKRVISGEDAFQVLAHSFSVSPSNEGYTLNYSANGTDWTAYDEATPSGENLIVNGIAKGMWFKLEGNASNVEIIY